jgi:hypothetical protein
VFVITGSAAMMNRDVTARQGAASETRARADRTALRRLLVEWSGSELSEAQRVPGASVAERR